MKIPLREDSPKRAFSYFVVNNCFMEDMEKKKTKKTVIIGAGLTGLTAAYFLAKGGRKCLLLEKEGEEGGMSRSYTLDGVTFDLGPHLFFPNSDFEAERFMQDLLAGEEVIQRRFRFSIFTQNRHWKFPLSVVDMMLYPWRYKKHFILNFFQKGKRTGQGNVSAKDDIVTKSGETYYSDVFASMLERKTLFSGEQLHKDWLARIDRDVRNRKEEKKEVSRSGEVSHLGLVKKLFKSFFQHYAYPARGFQVFSSKILEKYQALGGEVIFQCGPIQLNRENGKVVSVGIREEEFEVEDVVWTGSVNGLNKVLGAESPTLHYVKTSLVLLTYQQKKPVSRPFVYSYYPDEQVLFNRVYFPTGIYRNVTPAGVEGVCLEVTHDGAVDGMSDDSLITSVVAGVEEIGVFERGDLRQAKVVHLDECMPIYSLEYEAEMSRSFDEIWRYSNLYSVGRLGGYFFCLSPPAVSQGMKIARHLLGKYE